MKNKQQYIHLDKVIAVYAFFQQHKVPLKFTFEDLHFCLVNFNNNQTSNEPTYLFQYLMIFFFEQYLQNEQIFHPYPQLLLNSNAFIQQCIIYSQLTEIYQFVVTYTKEEKRQVEFSDPIESDQKINALSHLVNYIAPKSKWMLEIREKQDIVYQPVLNEKSFKEKQLKWQEELQNILNKKDELLDELISNKSKWKLKQKQKELEDLNKRAQVLDFYFSLNFREISIFGFNPMKLVYTKKYLVWIIKSMPDYILVQEDDQYYLLYGIEVHEFLKETNNEELSNALKEYDFCQKSNATQINDWVKCSYPYHKQDYQEFLAQGGRRDCLLYLQKFDNLEKIIMNIILDIEEKVTASMGNYYQLAWNYKSVREQWRKQTTQENAIDKLYDLTTTFAMFRSNFYDFSSQNEVPDDYKSRNMPLNWVFKCNMVRDLKEVDNYPYTYALLLYSRFITQIQKIKQSQKLQVQEPKRQLKKVIEDESDLDDYYYK